MKKFFISFLLLTLGFSVYAYDFHYEENGEESLIQKHFSLINGKGDLLIMNNNSVWIIYPVKKRKRSIREWWNDVQIASPEEEFLFDFSHWEVGTKLQPFAITWASYNQEIEKKYNQPKLSQCTHVLYNGITGQMAFAKKATLSIVIQEFLEYAKQQYKRGYNKGYQVGYDKARNKIKQQEIREREMKRNMERQQAHINEQVFRLGCEADRIVRQGINGNNNHR